MHTQANSLCYKIATWVNLRSLPIFAQSLVRSSAILLSTRPNATCIIARSWGGSPH